MEELKEKYPDKDIEVWTYDEHRLGLISILKRIWFPRGIRPVIKTKRQYEWLYLYGFVRPATGDTFWLILSSVNTELTNIALKEFAEYINPDQTKQILLVLDGAGFHTAKEIKVPAGISLEFLPPYSPELQPAERLWSLTDQSASNKIFTTIKDLEENQSQRCQEIIKQKEIVKNLCHYSWWTDV